MRICITCKTEKTLDNTNVDNSRKDGLNKYCKKCIRTVRNTEEEVLRRKKRQKEYYIKNKSTIKKNTRDYILKRKFDISEDDYTKMLVDQNYCCSICGRNELEFSRRLAVDHCHNTGKVRGLLCFNCNNGLGRFKDSTRLLNEAIKYLEENTNGNS
jgi:hypothetical protein